MGLNSSRFTVEEQKTCVPSPFDALLYYRNVPHILEKIFFNLDYESFKTCMEVCQTWKKLLSSAPYQEKLLELLIPYGDRLHQASRDGNIEEVRRLASILKHDVNLVKEEGLLLTTPLLKAVCGGHREIVKVLLDAGADPNKGDVTRYGPLHYAAGVGNGGIVRALLDGGADPNKTSFGGYTPLDPAIHFGNDYVAKMLLDRGAGFKILQIGLIERTHFYFYIKRNCSPLSKCLGVVGSVVMIPILIGFINFLKIVNPNRLQPRNHNTPIGVMTMDVTTPFSPGIGIII